MSKAKYDTKIEIFIPEQYVLKMRDELAKVNVGRIGNYDHCVAVTNVRGYFRPLEGVEPFEGIIGIISEVPESKLEVSCLKEDVPAALQVVRRIHPYEEPLVNIIPLSNGLYTL